MLCYNNDNLLIAIGKCAQLLGSLAWLQLQYHNSYFIAYTLQQHTVCSFEVFFAAFCWVFLRGRGITHLDLNMSILWTLWMSSICYKLLHDKNVISHISLLTLIVFCFYCMQISVCTLGMCVCKCAHPDIHWCVLLTMPSPCLSALWK